MQAANGLTMRLESKQGRWVLMIEASTIETKRDAILAAKNVKVFARLLPDAVPRAKETTRRN